MPAASDVIHAPASHVRTVIAPPVPHEEQGAPLSLTHLSTLLRPTGIPRCKETGDSLAKCGLMMLFISLTRSLALVTPYLQIFERVDFKGAVHGAAYVG